MTAADVPVELGRDAAGEAARAELAEPAYAGAQPSLLERFRDWLGELLDDLRTFTADVSPVGYGGLVLAVLAVVAAVVLLRLHLGPVRRSAQPQAALLVGAARTGAQHRDAAERHAAAGAWDEAVREQLRALVRGLEERGLLDVRPGRTADEAAAEAGAVLPEHATQLRLGARIFDDIWYGGRPGSPDAYHQVRDLEQRVREARPRPASAAAGARQ